MIKIYKTNSKDYIMNWNNIISLNGSQNNAFEELVCQLASLEFSKDGKFIKVGNPDAGVECYIIKENGDEIGFQAKYFLSTPQQTQWNQLDSSIKTALEKHPNLKSYYVAIPIDRADPRVDNKESFKDKWEKWVKKWQDKAKSDYSKEIDIVYWGSHELIKMLKDEKSTGLVKCFFGDIDLSNNWFNIQNDNAIKSLGARYSSQISIELEIYKYFKIFDENSQYLAKTRSKFFEIYNKFCKDFILLTSVRSELKNEVNLIKQFVSNLNFANFDYDKFERLLDGIQKIIFKNDLVSIISSGEESNEDKFQDNIYDFYNFIRENKKILQITKDRCLILCGDAGVGKSHLFADIVKNRANNQQQSILILGQHLTENKDPWAQILNLLGFSNFNKNEFLLALNSKAKAINSKIVIFIDAINEGAGKDFWRNFIISFVEDIKRHEWLGVAFSIRSSYIEHILPCELSISKIFHNGFSGANDNAVDVFFDYYNIPAPRTLLFNPEFLNPLFLKLFCEGFSQKDNFMSHINFSQIVQSYIDHIQNALILKYPNCKSLGFMQKAIDTIVALVINIRNRVIDYESGFIAINETLQKFGADGNFLNDLVAEGLLSKNIIGNKEYVYFTYEKLSDYFIAKYLIEKLDKNNLKQTFTQYVLPYLKTDGFSYYTGLIEALSVQIPEKFNGTEIYELLEPDNMLVVDCFLRSLPYRSTSIPQSTVERVLKNISNENFNADIFYMLYSCATLPNHPFNAEFMFDYLSKFSMKERDSFFITILNKIYLDTDMNPIVRLIDWCWSSKDKSYIDDESIFLAAIAIAWLFSTSNRRLRDSATKALICILINRTNLILKLLQKFKNIDEPYISERLFAATYGALVKTTETRCFKELGEYIYNQIFNKYEVYPHILLRDYARNSIDFIMKKGINLDISIDKVDPPYKSYFPSLKELPSNEEIKKYEDRDKNYHQSSIISSMATEKGINGYMYGDFGRYVFESALYDFECKDSAGLISNYAIKNIFEKYGYDGEYFNEAENNIKDRTKYDLNRYKHTIERVGKKYQWISFYETMARITDNFKMYVGYGDNKREVKYIGAFEPYVRDIDPTILLKNYERNSTFTKKFWWDAEYNFAWDMENKKWLEYEKDLPNLSDILERKNDKEQWITLSLYQKFIEPLDTEDILSVAHKDVRLFIRSYIVKKHDITRFAKTLNDKPNLIYNLIDLPDCYKMFNMEHYNYVTYDALKDDYRFEWFKIEDIDAANTTIEYFWEAEFDASKSDVFQICKPSKILYDGLRLKYSKKDIYFLDKDGNTVCFDPSSDNQTAQRLLIKKDKLNEFLNVCNMCIVWIISGEKLVFTTDNVDLGRLYFNGYAFFGTDGNLKEYINKQFEKHFN